LARRHGYPSGGMPPIHTPFFFEAGGDLVAEALAGDLPLELGEGRHPTVWIANRCIAPNVGDVGELQGKQRTARALADGRAPRRPAAQP
jgi:hypothetical protein